MNDEAAAIEPEPPPQDIDEPFLEEAREIEREMYQIMATQVRLGIIQVVLATLGIVTACVMALLH